MILQALTEHYEVLVQQGKLAKPGWANSRISFALCINDQGELEQVVVTKVQPSQDSKKQTLIPRSMVLPAPVKRGNDIVANFLWDNATYLLGADAKGNPKRSLNCFCASRNLHHQILDGVVSPAAKALLAFFDHWEPAQAQDHPALQENWEELIAGANLVFRYNGSFVHEDPLIRQAWQCHYDTEENGPQMVCMVTGRTGPVEAVHPAIKGVMGAKALAALVSFNAPAFCSYGKEQNLNAPVSKQAAFAYTAALNYLVADREHTYRVGDTTVLFWARDGQTGYQDILFGSLFGEVPSYTPGELADMVKHLLRGDSVRYDETLLDPNMDFYILGISPNAARLSVRFFLHNTFGDFLRNVQAHQDRLEIVRSANDKFDAIPLWKLLSATVNQNSRDKSPSPLLAGEVLRAILTDTRYPASLLNGVTLRIRADHQVDRSRAAILKAYYLKNPHPSIPKEVLTVSLNPACEDPAYVLGRLFSVYEAIQTAANPGLNTTIKDKYFNSAASTPATIFPILGNLAQKHLKKLKGSNMGLCVFYEKQLGEISSLLTSAFPTRMSLPQQGSFQLGYYHQTQARYQKKEDTENV